MAFWFLAGDFSVTRTAAHCVFLAFIFLVCWMSWRARGWALTAPFLVILLPGLALHSLTMALIGHAAYSIPYVVPLAMPLALVAAKRPALARSPRPAEDAPGELYALSNVRAIVFDVDGTLYAQGMYAAELWWSSRYSSHATRRGDIRRSEFCSPIAMRTN